MKLQQVLEYLELEQLPQAGTSTSQKKCACLVERVTGVKDYAIAKNGGIVVDLNFTASIKRIVEFYPVQKKKEPEVTVIPPPIPTEDLAPKIEGTTEGTIGGTTDMADLEEVFPSKDPQPVSKRGLMIAFLETQRNKRATLDLKTDDQLAEMCKRFGKEF